MSVQLLSIGFFVAVFALPASALKVVRDGQPVEANGIFVSGCIYGLTSSLSDHAPMLWPADKIGTWNITSRVSHKIIKTPKGEFMGHKFKTNSDGVLVDKKGKPAILGYSSEVDILSRTTVTNQNYGLRLKRIARKIKYLFTRHKLNFLAVQEVPYKGLKDVDGNNMQEVFANELRPELAINYPSVRASSSDLGDKVMDVAMVVRANTPIFSPAVDINNRIQAFCDRKSRECVASAHLNMAFDEDDVKERCQSIQKMVDALNKRGFKKISVIGDFNMSASRLARFCEDVKSFSPVIKTSNTKAKSCSTNRGDPSPDNIDIMLSFEK